MKANLTQRTTGTLLGLGCCLSLFLVRPQAARACACCADPGTWFERTETLETFQFETLNDLDLGSQADLYLTAAGFEGIEGIDSPQPSYRLSKSNNGRSWNLRFINENGETAGNLSFYLPGDAVYFGTDMFDDPRPDNRLYKEIRFRGNIAGNGVFADVTDEAQMTLILKGRGNVCLTSTEYRHWILEVSGPGVSFSFFGEISPN